MDDVMVGVVAKDENRMVSIALLHIMEMPANKRILNGLAGEVLNVFTEKEYRGRGLCTTLMKKVIEYGKERGSDKTDIINYINDNTCYNWKGLSFIPMQYF